MNASHNTRNPRRPGAGLLIALAGAVLTAGFGVANAAPADDQPSMVVKYDDLDLSSKEGTLALYQRIAAAARQVCPNEETRQLGSLEFTLACRRAAVDRAVSTLHNPQLAALHSDHTHRG